MLKLIVAMIIVAFSGSVVFSIQPSFENPKILAYGKIIHVWDLEDKYDTRSEFLVFYKERFYNCFWGYNLLDGGITKQLFCNWTETQEEF